MLIAGAGIIGLTCAWRLAQRGVPVTIFDARETGAEASWAGAGMLSPGDDVHIGPMAVASLAQYSAFVEELQEASSVSIDYRRCGAIELAFTDQEAHELKQRSELQAVLGIRSESVDTLSRFYPDDALVDPRDVTAALRIACLRAGVSFHEHEPVRAILQTGFGVRTTKSDYRDDSLLITAGAWSSTICPPGPARTKPVRGHLIAFDGTSIRLDSILRHQHTYIVQRERTGRIIAGSSTEDAGFDRTIDRAVAAGIHRRAAQLLPALAPLQPSDVWLGFRPGLKGEARAPIIGRIEGTSIWTAFGHYRNGILLAPETARIISESVIGR